MIGSTELNTLKAIVTPEPGFYGVLSLGLSGIVLLIGRRSEKSQPQIKAPAECSPSLNHSGPAIPREFASSVTYQG
jgi:hypothetical protein